jgi:hypothetical protein
MLSLKKILINISIIFALLFGVISSATASESSFEETKARAEKGSSFDQVYLGQHYMDGIGVRQDYSKAFEWYKKAADQGDSNGQFNVGYLYSSGLGVRQDYSKAFEWYNKSAKQNSKIAQASIGILYESGLGIRQNKTMAKEWYGKSCDNGFQGGCDHYRRLNEQGY